MLGIIEQCTNTAKQFYNKISQEEEIDTRKDSGDDFHESDDDDNDFTYNSEKTPVNQVAT